jgi:hypothetical protein
MNDYDDMLEEINEMFEDLDKWQALPMLVEIKKHRPPSRMPRRMTIQQLYKHELFLAHSRVNHCRKNLASKKAQKI